MKKIFTHVPFDARPHLVILKELLLAANVLVLGLFLFVNLIFYDYSFETAAQLLQALTLAGWASLLAVGVSFVGFLGDAAIHLHRNRNINRHLSKSTKEPGVLISLSNRNHIPAA